MIRGWLMSFEVMTGLDTPQLQAISAILAIVGFFLFHTGRVLGWQSARRELRQFKKHLDDDHIVIERLIFESQADGSIVFDRETEGGIHPLKEVFGSDKLVELIQAAIRKLKHGEQIFPPGAAHRLMMERIDAFITGNDRAASQSAMFGRQPEYHNDLTAFTVKYMTGEDGFAMLHVLLVNPADLMMIKERPEMLAGLMARHQSYEKKYFVLLPELAKAYDFSSRLFRVVEDEDEAGEQAPFWTALIRTRKASAL